MTDAKRPEEKKPADKNPEGSEGNEDEPDQETSKLGRFIMKYHTFLSSFVIGVAGLIATSIWQYRQSETARKQAESQQKVAETQADNSWKIERAKILAQNLGVLAASGPNTAEQRFGVLLSLARGNILDPELAVSYALELGKDNPDYMESVLASTSGKDYLRLLRSFTLSCEERYGVTRNSEACVADKLAPRSAAIARLIADETQAAWAQNQPGPLALLKDERRVQQNIQKLSWLFDPTLAGFYERRQWNEIARFEKFSPGAHLVSALVLAAARTGEFVTTDEARTLERFHADHRRWLTEYLFGNTCDGECKARLMDVMVSAYAEAQGDYDVPVKTLIERPHLESGTALARLHARLLWCQTATEDLAPLRDHVLVPAATELLAKPKEDPAIVGEVVGLVALAPEPAASQKDEAAAWRELMSLLEKPSSPYGRIFRERRATAQRERQSPPPAMKKISFCGAQEVTPTPGD